MDSPLAVRLFEDSDAAALTELLHAAYAELGAMGLNYTAVDQDEQTTRERALGGRCWIAERAGAFIGSLTVSSPPSDALRRLTPVAREPDRAWLNQVAVAPSARGQGIASELWRRARRWAREQGASSIGVDTAAPAAHLVALYRARGFEPVDRIQWLGKTYDSVVMVRRLDASDAERIT